MVLPPDSDPQETEEWLEALDSVFASMTDDLADLRQECLAFGSVRQTGHPEVQDLRLSDASLALLGQFRREDIVGLQVAVDHSVLMRVIDRVAHARHELEAFLEGMPQRYLSMFSPETIFQHVELARGIGPDEIHGRLGSEGHVRRSPLRRRAARP